MPRFLPLLRSPLFWMLTLAGALLGGLSSPGFRSWRATTLHPWLDTHPMGATLLFMVLGSLCAIALFLLLVRFWGVLHGVGGSGAKLDLPELDLSVHIDRRQQETGWRIFMELATRIEADPLTEESSLREILQDLIDIMQHLHDELGHAPADRLHQGAGRVGLHAYGLVLLNHGLRPCIDRWHPRLEARQSAGLSERGWPWQDLCRQDLEACRRWIVEQTLVLGEALGVDRPQALLSRPDDRTSPRLVKQKVLEARDQSVSSELQGDVRRIAWRIHVELETRAPRPSQGRESLRETLPALDTMVGIIREELKSVGPVHGPVSEIAFRLLNGELRNFLAEWHRRFALWETDHPDAEETAWSSYRECRSALHKVHKQLSEESATLAILLGLDGEPGAIDFMTSE